MSWAMRWRTLARSDAALAAVVAGVAAEVVLAAGGAVVCESVSHSGLPFAYGVTVAGVFFATGMLAIWAIVRRTATFAQAGALAVFALQVLLLAGLFDTGRGPGFDRATFAGGVIAGTAVWQAALVSVFRRVRSRVYDEPRPASPSVVESSSGPVRDAAKEARA